MRCDGNEMLRCTRNGLLCVSAVSALTLLAAPVEAAPFFETVWETELGSGQNAVSDGGNWDRVETNEPSLAQIRAADGEDLPPELAGENMAAINLQGEPNWMMVTKEDVGTDSEDHFYWRMYLRVSGDTETNWGSVHPFQDFETGEPEGGLSMNFYLGLSGRNEDRSGWSPYFASYAPQPEMVASYFTLNAEPGDPYLDTDKWYRFEGHIEYLEREGAFARVRYDIHIFDPLGDPDTPVFTSDEFSAADCMNECYASKLGDHYDDGEAFYFRSESSTFTIGNNGPAQASGNGDLYDVTGVAFSHDGWIGPYGGAPPEGTTGDSGDESSSGGDDSEGTTGDADPTTGSATSGAASSSGSSDTSSATSTSGDSDTDGPDSTAGGQNDDGAGCGVQTRGGEPPLFALGVLVALGWRRRSNT